LDHRSSLKQRSGSDPILPLKQRSGSDPILPLKQRSGSDLRGADMTDVLTDIRWVDVCAVDAIVAGTGVCARVDDEQVAVFRLVDGTVYAIGNRDPFSGIQCLSRGILGDAGGVPKVASPVYKHCFDLRTGTCLDDQSVSVPAYAARIDEARVQVAVGQSAVALRR
jgi:nitrite reductase (NADH) small subunit